MAADGTAIVKRYERLKNDRYNFDNRWEQMAPFIAPSRVGIITQYPAGTKQTRNVYDSTTMMAAEMMAMFVAGHIINPAQRWLEYEMDPSAENNEHDNDDIDEWLEECRDRSYARLNKSMFYAEAPEALVDYVGFGTGFLLTEEAPQPEHRVLQGFRGFNFGAEKTGRYVIADGPDGRVDTAMREFQLSTRVAVDRWGLEVMPEKIQNEFKAAKVDELHKFIHAIYPRPTGEQSSYGNKGLPWVSCWVHRDTKTVVHEGGYREFPAAIPRYHRTPGEVYGRGRGDIAFPDTWTLNTAKRMGLEDWALKIKPPVMVRHDSVFGTLRLTPNAPTSINTHGGRIQDTVMPWQTGSHPEVSHINEEELRKSIREVFYVDSIRQLMEVNKSEMTAFEFAKKLELLFKIMSPVYGRMEYEFLHRIVDSIWELQLAARDFSPPPSSIQRTNGVVSVRFENPITKAQRSGDSEALSMTIQDLSPLAQLFPQMLDRFDPDEIAVGVADRRGLPATWMRSDDQLAKFRAEQAKHNAIDNQLHEAQQTSEIAKNAAPFIKAIQPAPKAA